MIEGYFFYTALVTVFEPERFRMFIFYLLGYGVPAVVGTYVVNFIIIISISNIIIMCIHLVNISFLKFMNAILT